MEARNTALSDAQREAAKLASWQTKTEDKARLEKDLQEAKGKLTGLGAVPEHANKTAALIASAFSFLGATDEGVEEWLPFVRSLLIEMLNRLAPGFVFLFILGLFDRTRGKEQEAAADIEAKPDARPVATSEDPASSPSTRTTRKRTPKSEQDMSGKVIRLPKAEDARALIAEGRTQKEAAKLLGVTDRTIRRWLPKEDRRPAGCRSESGQDAARDAA